MSKNTKAAEDLNALISIASDKNVNPNERRQAVDLIRLKLIGDLQCEDVEPVIHLRRALRSDAITRRMDILKMLDLADREVLIGFMKWKIQDNQRISRDEMKLFTDAMIAEQNKPVMIKPLGEIDKPWTGLAEKTGSQVKVDPPIHMVSDGRSWKQRIQYDMVAMCKDPVQIEGLATGSPFGPPVGVIMEAASLSCDKLDVKGGVAGSEPMTMTGNCTGSTGTQDTVAKTESQAPITEEATDNATAADKSQDDIYVQMNQFMDKVFDYKEQEKEQLSDEEKDLLKSCPNHFLVDVIQAQRVVIRQYCQDIGRKNDGIPRGDILELRSMGRSVLTAMIRSNKREIANLKLRLNVMRWMDNGPEGKKDPEPLIKQDSADEEKRKQLLAAQYNEEELRKLENASRDDVARTVKLQYQVLNELERKLNMSVSVLNPNYLKNATQADLILRSQHLRNDIIRFRKRVAARNVHDVYEMVNPLSDKPSSYESMKPLCETYEMILKQERAATEFYSAADTKALQKRGREFVVNLIFAQRQVINELRAEIGLKPNEFQYNLSTNIKELSNYSSALRADIVVMKNKVKRILPDVIKMTEEAATHPVSQAESKELEQTSTESLRQTVHIQYAVINELRENLYWDKLLVDEKKISKCNDRELLIANIRELRLEILRLKNEKPEPKPAGQAEPGPATTTPEVAKQFRHQELHATKGYSREEMDKIQHMSYAEMRTLVDIQADLIHELRGELHQRIDDNEVRPKPDATTAVMQVYIQRNRMTILEALHDVNVERRFKHWNKGVSQPDKERARNFVITEETVGPVEYDDVERTAISQLSQENLLFIVNVQVALINSNLKSLSFDSLVDEAKETTSHFDLMTRAASQRSRIVAMYTEPEMENKNIIFLRLVEESATEKYTSDEVDELCKHRINYIRTILFVQRKILRDLLEKCGASTNDKEWRDSSRWEQTTLSRLDLVNIAIRRREAIVRLKNDIKAMEAGQLTKESVTSTAAEFCKQFCSKSANKTTSTEELPSTTTTGDGMPMTTTGCENPDKSEDSAETAFDTVVSYIKSLFFPKEKTLPDKSESKDEAVQIMKVEEWNATEKFNKQQIAALHKASNEFILELIKVQHAVIHERRRELKWDAYMFPDMRQSPSRSMLIGHAIWCRSEIATMNKIKKNKNSNK